MVSFFLFFHYPFQRIVIFQLKFSQKFEIPPCSTLGLFFSPLSFVEEILSFENEF